MKNLFRLSWIVVLVSVIGFTMASCATTSTIGAASGGHGIFTGNGSTEKLTENAQEIASYSVILGLVDSGYTEYAAAVKKAEESGKKITSVTKWFLFLTKTTAYAK